MLFQMLHQTSAGSVNNTFRLSGRATWVHDEEGMIERKLLKSQNVSLRIVATQIDEFRVENLLLIATQFDISLAEDEGENDDLNNLGGL